FFFSSRRRHTRFSRDWSSDVCSSDLSIRYLNFDTNLLAMEAAINGVGIGLGRRPLVDGDLKVGRLVEIGAPTVRGRTGFWLMGSERAFRRAPVKAFRRWVLSEFERDSAQIDGR